MNNFVPMAISAEGFALRGSPIVLNWHGHHSSRDKNNLWCVGYNSSMGLEEAERPPSSWWSYHRSRTKAKIHLEKYPLMATLFYFWCKCKCYDSISISSLSLWFIWSFTTFLFEEYSWAICAVTDLLLHRRTDVLRRSRVDPLWSTQWWRSRPVSIYKTRSPTNKGIQCIDETHLSIDMSSNSEYIFFS